MSDATPPPPAPEQPVTPPPAAAPAPAYAPGTPAPKQTLSLVSFIVGLVALVFSWVPILGLLAGIAGIVIGVMARKREPAAPKWMWIVGIIAGAVAILIGLITLIGWIISLVYLASLGSIANTY